MWFDIVKLDLSRLSPQIPQIQGDAEGKNINIPKSSKCLDRLLNFAKKAKKAFGPTTSAKVLALEKDHRFQMSESVACKLVEMIDKMFSQTSEKYEDREEISEISTLIYLDLRYEIGEDIKNFADFFHIGAGYLFDMVYVIELRAPKNDSFSIGLQKKIIKMLKTLWEES
tara:strand:- start:574 stop:1083 length:510 start_codon:yes stop_codon:yes gene_type:complete